MPACGHSCSSALLYWRWWQHGCRHFVRSKPSPLKLCRTNNLNPVIEIRNLTKSYRGPKGTVRALAGVSLEVRAGECVMVLGPSGCGKTTLLLTVGALLPPDQGNICIQGRELTTLSPEEQARFRSTHIGFVFQQFHLLPYLSVRDNVLTASLGTRATGANRRADDLIARFGLEARAHHLPAELSTGERQRTALARALLNGPSLILADEPTGNLDEENARVVLGCLREIANGGGAVLLVTHNSNLARPGDRVLRLQAGQLTSVDEACEQPDPC